MVRGLDVVDKSGYAQGVPGCNHSIMVARLRHSCNKADAGWQHGDLLLHVRVAGGLPSDTARRASRCMAVPF